ncbi:MAG: hypothetical protein L0332_05465 [Chloroflexi bacterium]|nr:hypothetical protein [Chloroflexota bacterium]MCI0579909.1 hypothetical protein [Chloroflexota bacterium]MCI0646492.1 hypothetical protein [Chloroflexota bacterium]MCI0726156.1 hypothetical protein [Chloroflexota bacterium]
MELAQAEGRVKRGWQKVRASPLWREHGWPILLYLALSAGLTWPLLPNFTSHIPGHSYDAYNGLWVMWHTKEALLGRQPLFGLPILYYPHGATLLTHVPGPATGLLALPFWPWGPEAAHNGAVLISFVLTGYFTYLLARALGLERPVAFFAGLLLLVAPMHLAGLLGHTTKVFLGATPLVLLGLHRTLDLARPERPAAVWAVGTAVALLLTMLHDSFQFITAVMALPFFALFGLATASPAGRLRLLRRLLFVALASAIIVGPLLLMTVRAAYDPAITFDHNLASFTFQPDLVELILPTPRSRLLGPAIEQFLYTYNVGPGIETAVSISWVALALMAVVAVRGGTQARFWLAFTFVWVVLSLGPALSLLGRTTFTEYGLPIILPYAFLTKLPGLDFLRTPGRFMQIGFAGVAIAAAWGLAWLRQRWPQRATALTVAAVLLVLLESWPQPWPMMRLRPTPAFYQQLAGDEEVYGVLDLPITADDSIPTIMYNATYQMYQMAHGKGIAMGYISRTYASHPIFPCLYDLALETPDVLVNGEPAPCPFHALYDLPLNNYRYVVWHKPQPEYGDYKPGSPGELAAAEFVARYFAGQEPVVEDELVVVYAVPPTVDASLLPTTLMLGENWHGREEDGNLAWRWARSPATLILNAPRRQEVVLEILTQSVYDPSPEQDGATRGRLQVEMDTGFRTVVEIEPGQLTTIPLELPAGKHTLTLGLESGNYQPSAYGVADSRWLSFAVRWLNLRTVP